MKTWKCALCLAAAFTLLAGCTKEVVDDGPKPWAASSTSAVQDVPETEFTHEEELETVEALTLDASAITLPQAVSAADIEQLEQTLWMQMFYADYDCTNAETIDAMQFVTDGSVPWGLWYLYDASDPLHQHGEYEKLSVVDNPDPRGEIPDEYYKVDAAVVDFLMTDVLHGKADPDAAGDGWYRDGDFWYFRCLATGMEGYSVQVHACQTLENGHYRITAELLNADYDAEPEHERSAFLETDIEEKDGLRYWTIYNIETFE